MEIIHVHKDVDGDELEIVEAYDDHEGELVFNVLPKVGPDAGVFAPREQVQKVYEALGAWLFRTGTGPVKALNNPEPLYAALIRRQVAEEVARVLGTVTPLHSSPQATVPLLSESVFCVTPNCDRFNSAAHLEHDLELSDVVPVMCTRPNCGHPRDMHGNGFSAACNCGDCPEFTSDPEPHDVGHAESPTEHRPQECPGLPACSEGEPTKPRLMAELPRRTPSVVNRGTLEMRCDKEGCGHHRADHGAAHCWGNSSGPECTCMGFSYGPNGGIS